MGKRRILSLLIFLSFAFPSSTRAGLEFEALVRTSEEILQSNVFQRPNPPPQEAEPPKEEGLRVLIKNHLIRVEKEDQVQIYDSSNDTLTFLDPEVKEASSFPAERLREMLQAEWRNRQFLMEVIGESLPEKRDRIKATPEPSGGSPAVSPRDQGWFLAFLAFLVAKFSPQNIQPPEGEEPSPARPNPTGSEEVERHLKHQAIELGVAAFPVKVEFVKKGETKSLLGHPCEKYEAQQDGEKLYEGWIATGLNSERKEWATYVQFLSLYGGHHKKFLNQYARLPGIPLWEKRRKNRDFGFEWEEIEVKSVSFGELDGALFRVPEGYTEAEAPFLQ